MKNKIEISYYRPSLSKRLFSRIVDALILALFSLGLFVSIKAIYSNTDSYKSAQQTLINVRVDSGIYDYKNNELINVATICYQDTKMSDSQKETYLLGRLDKFFKYMESYSHESYLKVKNDYDTFRLSSTLNYTNNPLFIKENDEIMKNTSVDIPIKSYVEDCYSVYIDTNCNGFLTTEIKEYYESNKLIGHLTFFINIPISVFVSSLLVFLVPPLIFKKGRKTIGMLIYHIGFVNKELYNLSLKQFFIKFLVFYFFEFLLSVVTFGIPLIISLTMMLVTKNKQNFNEYMLNIQEVLTLDATIYNNKSEATIANLNYDEHVDFKMK